MNPSRRTLIGGILTAGTALAARHALATSIALPVLELRNSRLTQGGWARGLVRYGMALDLDGQAVATDANGEFLIAFDRDAGPSAILRARATNGSAATLP